MSSNQRTLKKKGKRDSCTESCLPVEFPSQSSKPPSEPSHRQGEHLSESKLKETHRISQKEVTGWGYQQTGPSWEERLPLITNHVPEKANASSDSQGTWQSKTNRGTSSLMYLDLLQRAWTINAVDTYFMPYTHLWHQSIICHTSNNFTFSLPTPYMVIEIKSNHAHSQSSEPWPLLRCES